MADASGWLIEAVQAPASIHLGKVEGAWAEMKPGQGGTMTTYMQAPDGRRAVVTLRVEVQSPPRDAE